MEWNPYLNRDVASQANVQAGKGYIEAPDDNFFNMVWQTRDAKPDEYQTKLCNELELIFAQGKYELKEVVEALQQSEVLPPNGQMWTEEIFSAEMHRLGK